MVFCGAGQGSLFFRGGVGRPSLVATNNGTLTVRPLSGVSATEAAWGPPLTVWLNSGQYCQPLVSLLDFALETKCSDQLCVFILVPKLILPMLAGTNTGGKAGWCLC